MALWQKRARVVVAVFGLACAVVVYFAIGHRPPTAAPPTVKRIDPNAVSESIGGSLGRFREDRRDFDLKYDTQLSYADGTTRWKKVTIHVTKPDGRSYVVDAGEAESSKDQMHLQLSAGVHLKASDGFELTADRAFYDKEKGAMHSDVPVAFSKGRMSGTGANVDYSEASDVLSVGQDAKVKMVDDEGGTTLDFAAGSAVLDRLQDVLTLDGHLHVLRDNQTMDADRGVAHLAPNDEFITFIELRGNSRVAGGGGTLDAMAARDIDLDYTDDGSALERVALNGGASARLLGANGAMGRQFTADVLEMRLGPDGMVTSASGRDPKNVRMVLPVAQGSPQRTITGKTFDAAGAPGQGLTSASFVDAVDYREEPTRESAGRVVHSRRLDLALSGDAVNDARFTGDVTFEEPSFRAQAANARFDPSGGTLHLAGSDNRGLPCLADDQIAVDAQTIDVTVENRRLKAVGGVKTTIRPAGAKGSAGNSSCALARQTAGGTSPGPAQASGGTKLPGLLKQDQLVTAAADSLDYGGTGKALVYTGAASLLQGDTSLRGDAIEIDQESGDLVATGSARFLRAAKDDRDRVDGRAEEIRYSDAKRVISYLNAPAATGKAGTGKTVRVVGPEGDLSANKVEIVLGKDDGKAEQLEAYQNVSAKIDTKKATADRLTYVAADEEYVMKGAGTVPVRFESECVKSSGKTVTYNKAKSSLKVLGEDSRTHSESSACQQSPAPTR